MLVLENERLVLKATFGAGRIVPSKPLTSPSHVIYQLPEKLNFNFIKLILKNNKNNMNKIYKYSQLSTYICVVKYLLCVSMYRLKS